MIKYAIFDMDGTLINSMYKWNRVILDYIENLGIKPDDDFIRTIKTKTLLTSIDYIHETFDIKKTTDDGLNFIYYTIRNGYMNEFDLKPGVLDMLEKLKSMGIKMCVATATEDHLAIPALEKQGILDYFEFVQTCKSMGYHKYEEEYWNNALEKLGSSVDDTIVFEDALYCIDTVDKMGFKIVGITDESTINEYDIIDEKVDQYIESYDDLDYDLFK